MDRHVLNALTELGCSRKEVQFYWANFSLGASTVNEVARTAKLQRSTAYLIAKELLEKGLISEDFRDYGKRLTAVEPAILLRMLRNKKRQLGRRELELENNLAGLEALYQSPELRPRVRTFQGTHGLVSIWKDILTSTGEILIWTNQETESKLFSSDAHDQFIEQRIGQGIRARVLAVRNDRGQSLRMDDESQLRQTRLLPPETVFSAETYIYEGKVATLDYNRDIVGIIIESAQVHAAQKAMFEALWDQLRE